MRWLMALGLGLWICGAWADQERYVKQDASGGALPAAADSWHCLHDRQTGLTWETKMAAGLRGRGHTYSWHQPGHPSVPGKAGLGRCEAVACDTHAYIAAVNALRLCGRDDWRLPEEVELFTLFYAPGEVSPRYFSDTDKASYWSGTIGPDGRSPVFVAFYGKGISYWHAPEQSKRVRLVSGRVLVQE